MRDFGIPFGSAIAEGDVSNARFAVEVVWDPTNSSVFFSHDAGAWSGGGRLFPDALTGEISSISQEINPESYRTTVGSFSCTLLDSALEVTTELNERIAAFALTDASVRLYVDLTGEYVLMGTYVGSDIAYDRSRGTYKLRARDAWASSRVDAFRTKRTKLSGPLLSGDIVNFRVTDAVAFDYVVDASLGVAQTYVRIDDELIAFQSFVNGVIFNLTRGQFNTERATYEDTGESDPPEVAEVIVFDETVIDLICLILTGHRLTGPQVWPDHWHIGLDRGTFIDVPSFQGIGADLIAIRARGVVHESKQAKSYIELQCLPLIGCVISVNPDGSIGLKRLSRALNSGAGSMVLNEHNLRDVRSYTYDPGKVQNVFTIQWNYSELDGEPTRTFVTRDGDSIATYGSKEASPLELGLLHGSIHTPKVIQDLVNYRRRRLTAPPVGAQATGLVSLVPLEPGDLVQLKWIGMPDLAGVDATQIDRTFEVRSVSVNWKALRVSLNLFGSTAAPPDLEAFDPVMADSFYTSEGFALPSVVGGSLVGSIAITAGTYFVDGDLVIPAGVTLTIAGTTQLRVKGTLTVDGTISGTLRGLPGGLTIDRPSSIQNLSEEAPRVIPAAVGGYVGATQGSDAERGAYLPAPHQ